MQQAIHRKAIKRKQPIQKKITKAAAIKIAEQLVTEIRKSGVNIRKAFLYGSYAKNQQRDWSDIDIALVADNFSGISFIDMMDFKKIITKEEYIPVQLKTYSTIDFDSDFFSESEIKKGVKIKA